MPVLASIQEQAALNSMITVRLSPMSFTVLLSASDYLSDFREWFGDDPLQLTTGERDIIDAITSKAYEELMKNAMIGMIIPLASEIIPDNCLPCDGSIYEQADYPELMEVLAPFFKLGDGTFFTPSTGGRALIGAGEGFGTTERDLWSFGGSEGVTLTEAQIPAHSHSYTPPVADIDLEDVGAPTVGAGVGAFPASTGNTGGGGSHENMMPWAAVPYVIVVR